VTCGLTWDGEGADWPNREVSRFIAAGPITFHVQRAGTGPTAFLVHGTGASTHSWRDVLPALATTCDVIAVDLPGHAFTTGARPEDLTLAGMAQALADLIGVLHVRPAVMVGHSAGAPIIAAMDLDHDVRPGLIVSLNGAWRPFPGFAGKIFPVVARLFHLNPAIARMVAWRAGNRDAIRRLIEGTGSSIDEAGLALYARLFQDPGHVNNVLRMMAGWDLAPLLSRIDCLETACLLMAASDDLAVPAETSIDLGERLANAAVEIVRGGGHLFHEVKPEETVARIQAAVIGEGL
jgi:magnesium chelatase accessory protein